MKLSDHHFILPYERGEDEPDPFFEPADRAATAHSLAESAADASPVSSGPEHSNPRGNSQ